MIGNTDRDKVFADIREQYGTSLTVAQACEVLGMSRNTLKKRINTKGGIRATDTNADGLNAVYRISARELARYIAG